MSVMIASPNRIDEATLSGGAWSPTLPLTNLQDTTISKVARTADVSNVSTQFNLTLSKIRSIKVFAFVNHNLSSLANYRIRATNESSATNLLRYSEQFNNAAWDKSNLSVSNDIGPNGLSVPCKITRTAVGNHYLVQTYNAAEQSNGKFTFSIFIKAGTMTGSIRVWLKESSGNSIGFFLASPTNEWQRFFISGDFASNTGQNIGCFIDPVDDVGFAGDTFYIFGAQLETGSVATSYYPATIAPATRPVGYIDNWQSYTYDTGVIPVWDVVYPSKFLSWEDENWWSGKTLEEDKQGYNLTLIKVLEKQTQAQYYKIEFFDVTNKDGYIDIGRMFLADGWQPVNNMSYGAGISYETKTTVEESIGGAEYFDRRKPYRVARFTLDFMSEDEGFSRAFDLQRRIGIDGEVLYMWNTKDTLHRIRRSFLGRLRTLNVLEMTNFDNTKMEFEIKERL